MSAAGMIGVAWALFFAPFIIVLGAWAGVQAAFKLFGPLNIGVNVGTINIANAAGRGPERISASEGRLGAVARDSEH